MSQRTYAGQPVEVDGEGFMTNTAQWSPQIAGDIAREVGIGVLTDKHWKVVEFARKDTQEQGQSPGPRRIVTSTGVTMKELYELFPKGPGKLVARIAGVPKPKSCL